MLKSTLNALAARFGLRIVNARWGPRGFAAAFRLAHDAGFRPGGIVDLGAARGEWTVECMTIFPEARYLLVEPLPSNRERLDQFAAAHPNVRVHNGAVGATEGVVRLHEHGDQTSALTSADFAGEPVEVAQRTLDALLQDAPLPSPLIVKIDVQGMETQVLAGASDTLARTDLLLVEVSFVEIYDGNCLAHDVIGMAAQSGFRIADICTYTQRPKDGLLAQSDLLFLRSKSGLFATKGW
jgi:FkbM family methyltransferase